MFVSATAHIPAHAIHAHTACMYSMHTPAACEWLQRLFMFPLPNVTQLRPPSTRSQTSYQEFSGRLSGSGSWSKLMAELQSSLQCETYPPIYHTDCRHDVVAGECAATHPTYVSAFFLTSFPSFFPAPFSLFFFHLVSCSSLFDCLSPLSFLSCTPPSHPFISLSLTLSSSCPCELPFSTLQKKTHTQSSKIKPTVCRKYIKFSASAAGYSGQMKGRLEGKRGVKCKKWEEMMHGCVWPGKGVVDEVTCVYRHWGLLGFLACYCLLVLHRGLHWKSKHIQTHTH